FPPPRIVAARSPQPGDSVLHVVYDVQQDRIRSQSRVPVEALGLGLSYCFDNSELTYPFPSSNHFVVPNPGEELVDWGFKTCRESSLLRTITIGYGSSAVDLAHGGPGGTLCLALYQGTRGFGRLGTEVFRRTISGLPTNGGQDPVFLTL